MRGGRWLWLAIPWLVSATGAAIAWQSGISPLVFVPNFAGAALGVLMSYGLVRLLAQERGALAVATFSISLLTSTLASEGFEGVFRWIHLGPIALNVSSAVMPTILFALVTMFERRRFGVALTLLAATQGVHALQPDAGQAGACCLAVLALAATSRGPVAARAAVTLLSLGGTLATLVRPDTLSPVAHVEGIVGLAHAHGTVSALFAWLAMALLLAPMVLNTGRGATPSRLLRFDRDAANAPLMASLAGYALATFLASALGHFPVPVLGAGAGPVIGASTYLTLALVVKIRPWAATTQPMH